MVAIDGDKIGSSFKVLNFMDDMLKYEMQNDA